MGHVSFASAHPGAVPYTAIQVPMLNSNATTEQMLWPDHCVQGTHVSRSDLVLFLAAHITAVRAVRSKKG